MLEFLAGGAVGALLGGSGSTHTQSTTLVPYEKTVHEHRAPTDGSIKLLREMEEKSRKQIACALIAEDNAVNGVVIQFHDEVCTYDRVCYVSFTLNGEKHEYKVRISGKARLLGADEALRMLVDTFVQTLTEKMTSTFTKGVRS